LTLAFISVGVTAGFAILNLSLDRYQHDFRSELTDLVSLASMSVDAEAHSKLVRPDQMNSYLYRREVAKLAKAKELIPGVRYIYTLRQTPNGYVFVLDPTPPGDHDGDGTDDKSYLGDPYPEMPASAKAAYEHGVVTVETEPTHDRWGTFISAYAPIRDRSGKVVAVLGIDRLANDIVRHEQDLVHAVVGGIVLVSLMGIYLGWAFSRKISSSISNHGWLRYLTGSTRIFRATILEIVLAGVSLVVLLGAFQGLATHQRSVDDLHDSMKRADALMAMESDADEVSARNAHDALVKLQEGARQADIAWLFQSVTQMLTEPESTWPTSIQSIKLQIASEFNREARTQSGLKVAMDGQNAALMTLFVVSALIAFAAIAVVRVSSNQQQDLIAARSDSDRHEAAYRQVVENLPIGLYIYLEGKIVFSNDAWDRQCGRARNEDRIAALSRAGGDELIEKLKQGEQTRTGFSCQYHLIDEQGGVQILETQVVATLNSDGELECLLGFAADQTQRARAQEELAARSRELHQKNRMLGRALRDREENLDAIIETMVKAVEAKCIYTAGHSVRVMNYSLAIAEQLRLEPEEVKALRIGTLLHDVGKIGVPDGILTKPAALTPEEYETIKAHAEDGARMVETIPGFKACVPIIRWHHERLVGRGYPDGLTGDQIPLLAQIAAVADCFDAMTTSRPYRPTLSCEEAFVELRGMAADRQLNPELVEILAEIVIGDYASWFGEPGHAA